MLVEVTLFLTHVVGVITNHLIIHSKMCMFLIGTRRKVDTPARFHAKSQTGEGEDGQLDGLGSERHAPPSPVPPFSSRAPSPVFNFNPLLPRSPV